jgi:sugar phosphate permease
MINLGQIGANQFARLLATGFVLPLVVVSVSVPRLDWQYMFVVPPIVLALVVLVMNLLVRNTPEEAGYHVPHEDDPGGDGSQRVRLRDVLRKIATNRIVWVVAGAYFCTGFVRSALVSWWAVYLLEVWHADRASNLFAAMAWGLPISATLGSILSGFVSDRFFAGQRAPVAMGVYLLETVVMLAAMTLSSQGPFSTSTVAVILLLAISTFCNSTHSILGTAAAMDLGGRKMAGCASGIIDSFQYYGAMLSGWGIGFLFVHLREAGVAAKDAPFLPAVWFGSMLPFSTLGMCLMGYLWIRHRGKQTLGA